MSYTGFTGIPEIDFGCSIRVAYPQEMTKEEWDKLSFEEKRKWQFADYDREKAQKEKDGKSNFN